MTNRLDQANLEHLIANTVTTLCKNAISYSSTLHIQGTVGITVDATNVVLVHINQSFEYSAEDSQRSASAHEGMGAGEGIKANTYLVADAKQPRMLSVAHCSRRPVGRSHVSVRPFGRVRSAQAVTGVQRLRHPGLTLMPATFSCTRNSTIFINLLIIIRIVVF